HTPGNDRHSDGTRDGGGLHLYNAARRPGRALARGSYGSVARRHTVRSVRATAILLGVLAVLGAGCAPLAPPGPAPLLLAAPLLQGQGPAPSGRIVFVAGGDLWQWHDGALRQLTQGDRYEGPAWSPDGDQIVASLVGAN